MTSERPKDWSKWIPLAEWWYNTNFHSSTQTTPYEIVYGQPPPVHLPYFPGDSKVEAVDRSLQTREAVIKLLKFYLARAQQRMKYQADKRRTDREFQVGDLVYVKLQPYRQKSVANRKCLKLATRYFRPYKILARVGAVAYRLELPLGVKVHLVFHVSQIKQQLGKTSAQKQLPIMDKTGLIAKESLAVMDKRMNKRKGQLCTEVLIQWKNCFPEDATWENLYDLRKQYLDFNP